MNKKGLSTFGIILIFSIVVAIVMVSGLFISIFVGSIDMVFDEFVPEMTSIGMMGNSTNISEYAEYTLTPINSVVQNFTWIGGIMYFFGIIMLFGIATSFKITNGRWLIMFYFLFALLLIFMSIFISNIYEDIYSEDGDLGTRLKEQVILSYLILHSPLIFGIAIFASGVILFTGIGEGQGI